MGEKIREEKTNTGALGKKVLKTSDRYLAI